MKITCLNSHINTTYSTSNNMKKRTNKEENSWLNMAWRINSGSKNIKSVNNKIAQNYTWHTKFPKHYSDRCSCSVAMECKVANSPFVLLANSLHIMFSEVFNFTFLSYRAHATEQLKKTRTLIGHLIRFSWKYFPKWTVDHKLQRSNLWLIYRTSWCP